MKWGQSQKDEQIMFLVITLKITFKVRLIIDAVFLNPSFPLASRFY